MNFWNKIHQPIPRKPKYRPGQLCLVISGVWREMLGQKVILGRCFDRDAVGTSGPVWTTDPPIYFGPWSSACKGFLEPWLLPLDDEDLNKSISAEEVISPIKIPGRERHTV